MFGFKKQIAVLQERIAELEQNNTATANALAEAESANRHLREQNEKLNKNFCDAKTELLEQQKSLSDALQSLDKEREASNLLRKNLAEETRRLAEMSRRLNETSQELEKLNAQLDYYNVLSPNKYLAIGAEHFSLEQLTCLLERAKSRAFVGIQNEHRKSLIQNVVNILAYAKHPVNKEMEILSLLHIAGDDEGSQVAELQKRVLSINFGKAILSHKDKYGEYTLVAKDPRHGEDVPMYLFDAKTPDEYARKLAICRLAATFKAIAEEKGGYIEVEVVE